MSYMDYTNLDFHYINKAGKIAYINSWDKKVCCEGYYCDLMQELDLYCEFKKDVLKYFCALVLPATVDQIWLYRNKELLEDFLARGGIIFDFAASFCEYLPNLPLYTQSKLAIKSREIKLTKHPICKGVREYDLNHRHGVKGFFNRGFIQKPLNAELILEDNEGECVAYIDKSSFKGILLKTAGADLMGLSMGFENDTSRRMGLNCLIWLEDELRTRL